MRYWLSLGLVMLAAVAAPLFSASKGDATAGKAVFTKRCVTCHGSNGEGRWVIAKIFRVEMPHLGSKEVQARSDADLGKVVTEGKGKMKPAAGLSEQEIADVIAFVRTLAQK